MSSTVSHIRRLHSSALDGFSGRHRDPRAPRNVFGPRLHGGHRSAHRSVARVGGSRRDAAAHRSAAHHGATHPAAAHRSPRVGASGTRGFGSLVHPICHGSSPLAELLDVPRRRERHRDAVGSVRGLCARTGHSGGTGVAHTHRAHGPGVHMLLIRDAHPHHRARRGVRVRGLVFRAGCAHGQQTEQQRGHHRNSRHRLVLSLVVRGSSMPNVGVAAMLRHAIPGPEARPRRRTAVRPRGRADFVTTWEPGPRS